MKAIPGSSHLASRPSLVGTLALLFLTACATAPVAEEAGPSDAERVDIGYGSVDKDHVVGSITTVQSEDLEMSRYRTLAEMLARVPGVRVIERNGSISVRIRGTNSFLGGEEPLFVLDGMVIQSPAGLGSINPSNVESITVLKDAGSTAVYGTRGANGVILIKTKRGSR